jgi:serine/threonine-protein kinase
MSDLAERLQAHLGADYAVQQELSGGMSRVFVARELALGREVVVKVLAPGLAATVSAERFRREIMLSASLQHPNIVPLLSSGEVDGLPYFVMPFVRGESLRVRLRRGPLSTRETIHVLRDVGRALAFAHGRGVVHRDIKPDNILLSSGAATVADFGVAKAIQASREQRAAPGGSTSGSSTVTGVGFSLGTPAYMAPEQSVADPSVDHRADLYALGVVGYEMLAGTTPFEGRPAHALVRAHLTEQPVPITARRYDVPAELAALIMACLEKAPERRPRSAGQLLQQLDDAAVSLDALHHSSTRADPGRERRAFAAGGGAALAIVLLAAFGARAAGIWPAGAPAAAATLADAGGGSTPAAVAEAAPARPARAVRVGSLRAAGGDATAAAVADGLSSELAGAISQLALYRVVGGSAPAARPATPGAAGGTTPAEAAPGAAVAAPSADPGLAIDGVVQRAGGRLRVSVRVVDVGSDSTLWAMRQDASVDSAFALQDAVTRSVAGALSLLARAP